MNSFIKKTRKQWHELSSGIKILFLSLSPTFRKILILLCFIFVISSFLLVKNARNKILTAVPISGGEWTEGIIGSPRFINPVLAVSNVDKDLTNIVYSGLMKKDKAGQIQTALAASYTVSENSLVYTVSLRDDIYFHNGKKITADDVLYTIEKIQDPNQKSPKLIEWSGITVNKIDNKTVSFTLKQPFGDFLDLLTIGIISKEVFGKYTSSEFSLAKENLEAIGSGPFKIKYVSSKKNIPTNIKLVRFTKNNQKPFIKKLSFVFYDTERNAINALKSGTIDHLGSVSSREATMLQDENYTITNAALPRLYGLFFNSQKSSVLVDKSARRAIGFAIDRQDLINETLGGFGNPIYSPMPSITNSEYNQESYYTGDAIKLLENNGWKKGQDGIYEKKVTLINEVTKKPETKTEKLAFTITTSESSELVQGAEKIASDLIKIGISVKIEQFDSAALEEKIKNRDYEALYYGILVSRESQAYAFWHSSQKNHPGLNITGYSNPRVDKALESLPKEKDIDTKNKLFDTFLSNFQEDIPAIFVYSPSYIYVHKKPLLFEMPVFIQSISDRFNTIDSWYLESDKVLNLFK